jgi:hypothetical protein
MMRSSPKRRKRRDRPGDTAIIKERESFGAPAFRCPDFETAEAQCFEIPKRPAEPLGDMDWGLALRPGSWLDGGMNSTTFTNRVGIVIGLLLVAVCLVVLNIMGPEPMLDTPTSDGCQEDEACWDCSVMGNGLCGPSEVLSSDD